MTRENHLELGRKYSGLAIQALSLLKETGDRKYWGEYKENSRLSRKHNGIAQAMFTRKYGKI